MRVAPLPLACLLPFVSGCGAPERQHHPSQEPVATTARPESEHLAQPTPEEDLLDAVARNDAAAITAIVAESRALGVVDPFGYALHYASSRDLTRSARALLAVGADPSARIGSDATPLHFARSVRMVRLLVAAGANVHALDEDGRGVADLCDRRIAPHVARQILGVLHEAGAPRSLRTAAWLFDAAAVRELLTPGSVPDPSVLHTAVARGDAAMVQVLLDAGCDPNLGGEPKSGEDGWDGWTESALTTAVQLGRFEIAKMLLERGARPRGEGWPVRRYHWTRGGLLERVAVDGPPDLLADLLEAGVGADGPKTSEDDRGDSALALAASHGRLDNVLVLLAHGADPERVSGGAPPLLHAAVFSHADVADRLLAAGARPSLLASVALGREAEVRRLLATGSYEVDAVDDRCRMTPLLWAICLGHDHLVTVLIEAGADVDRRGSDWIPSDLSTAWHERGFGHVSMTASPSVLDQAIEMGRYGAAVRLVDAGARLDPDDVGRLIDADAEAAPILQAFFAQHRLREASARSALATVLGARWPEDLRRSRFDLLLANGAGRWCRGEWGLATIAPGAVPLLDEMRRLGWEPDLETVCRLGSAGEVRRLACRGRPASARTIVLAAHEGDHPDVLHELRACWGDFAWTPAALAELAAEQGAGRVLRDLLSRGLVAGQDGAASRGDWARRAATGGHLELLGWMLDAGLVSAADAGRVAMLVVDWRTEAGPQRLPMLTRLLAAGADPDTRSLPDTLLARVVDGRPDEVAVACVRLLLRAGADPRAGDFLDSLAGWAEVEGLEPMLRDLLAECEAEAERLDEAEARAFPALPRPGTPAAQRPGTPAAPRPGTPAAPRPGTPAAPRPGTPARTR